MKRSPSLLALSLLIPSAALACPESVEAKAASEQSCHAGFDEISVNQLAFLQRAQRPLAIFDANRKETREKFGIIPNAQLLTSYADFDTTSLPKAKDALLVFYCANTKCTASHKAAERAAGAGYTNIYVLSAGIMGWRDAGQPVAKPNV